MRYGIAGFCVLLAGYALGHSTGSWPGISPTDAWRANLRQAWVFTFLGLTFTLCTVHIWTNIYSFVFFMFGAGMWLMSAEPGPGRRGRHGHRRRRPRRPIPASAGLHPLPGSPVPRPPPPPPEMTANARGKSQDRHATGGEAGGTAPAGRPAPQARPARRALPTAATLRPATHAAASTAGQGGHRGTAKICRCLDCGRMCATCRRRPAVRMAIIKPTSQPWAPFLHGRKCPATSGTGTTM